MNNINNNTNKIFDKKNELYNLLKTYPNFKKSRKIESDEIAGKKRKFL